ncbi:MAG: TlpA family protein disulfide reductase [Bacteroidetes bacterium]|nr:TlpA family protein disulfide reductase [Bacteroidota bacterium]MBU1484809.1 TlpA family protein disulfide reductase [Bacteroidota bacterium]MBU2046017.1 TlpA family protein disulfide reductase [Bacteroidota bacterium]MBU2267741.1 TlpA family protein disulfide reductase [Bacteroidota bacterium]MBU2375579.1 TlpA family protein disulfide reductase [Bacteroidota bacterium]
MTPKSLGSSGINVKIELQTKDIIGCEIKLQSLDLKTVYWSDTLRKNKQLINLNLPIKQGFYKLGFNGKYPYNKRLSGWMHDIILYLENNKTYQVFAGDDQTILYNHSKVRSNSETQIDLSLFQDAYVFKFDSLKKELKKKEDFSDTLFNSNSKNYDQSWALYLKEKDYLQKKFPVQFIRKFAIEHPNSIISPFKLVEVWDIQENYDLYKSIYDSLSTEIKWNEYAILFKQKLDAIKYLAYGNHTPMVVGKGLHNEDFIYDYSKNKFTLLEFWASWCKPCRDEHPELVEIYNEYHQLGFDILSISLDDKKELWEKAIEKDQLIWKNHFSDLKSFSKSENAIRFNIAFVPQNYLINSEGEIVTQNIELGDLKKFLSRLR